MSRVQLALNVSDLDEAVDFYSKLFATAPAKVRPGYANFAIADPPLKLVLDRVRPRAGARASARRSTTSASRWRRPTRWRRPPAASRATGLATTEEHETTCCYAVQDKVWVEDPDGAPWEVYTVLADAPAEAGSCGDGDSICCQLQGDVASPVTACC